MPAKKKSNAKSTTSSSQAHDKFARSAMALVDQAAEMLKKGILFGSEKTVESRRAMHKKAVAVANDATDKLTDAVNDGLRALNKKIKGL